jgi:hypothetical protein
MKLPARRGSAALIERARGFYSNIEKKRGRQYALTERLVRAAQGHREGEKRTGCGGSWTERYRCEDGARRVRTKSQLPRVAVAALRLRDLKSDLLKPGARWPSARSYCGRVSRRGEMVGFRFRSMGRLEKLIAAIV